MNLRELRQRFAACVAEAKELSNAGKLEEELQGDVGTPVVEGAGDKKTDVNKAFLKALIGKPLTPAENALIEKADTETGEPNGSILVPKDENTKINEYKRQYKSLRTHVREYKTTVISGSFV